MEKSLPFNSFFNQLNKKRNRNKKISSYIHIDLLENLATNPFQQYKKKKKKKKG